MAGGVGQGLRGPGHPRPPKAPTLQARGGLLRGDVLHHLGAPKDDVEPGVGLEVQDPVRVKVFNGLLRRKERVVRTLSPQPPSLSPVSQEQAPGAGMSHSDPHRAPSLTQHVRPGGLPCLLSTCTCCVDSLGSRNWPHRGFALSWFPSAHVSLMSLVPGLDNP